MQLASVGPGCFETPASDSPPIRSQVYLRAQLRGPQEPKRAPAAPGVEKRKEPSLQKEKSKVEWQGSTAQSAPCITTQAEPVYIGRAEPKPALVCVGSE